MREACAGVTTATTGPTSTRWASSAGDVPPVGALDQTRSEHSDLYSFDEDFERVEAERTGAAAHASPTSMTTSWRLSRLTGQGSQQAAQARARHGPHRSPRPVEPPARSGWAARAGRPPAAGRPHQPGGGRRRPRHPADHRLRHRLEGARGAGRGRRGGGRGRGLRHAAAVRIPAGHSARAGRDRGARLRRLLEGNRGPAAGGRCSSSPDR